jgi:hypothetical protein
VQLGHAACVATDGARRHAQNWPGRSFAVLLGTNGYSGSVGTR